MKAYVLEWCGQDNYWQRKTFATEKERDEFFARLGPVWPIFSERDSKAAKPKETETK